MVQFSVLAFMIAVNAPDYSISDSIRLMQERKPVVAASQEEDTSTFHPYNINLDPDIQKYIWNEAKKYNISFELMLAIAYTESKFDPTVVSWDGSSTGLFQLNTRNTVQWLSQETGINNVDPKNPYHSAKMAVWYINYLREKYLKEGYDEESVTNRVLLAYRFGVNGSKRKGLSHPYVKKVLEYKYKLESGEIDAHHP
jgi:soluble lytic murein transglycosylase-like protein